MTTRANPVPRLIGLAVLLTLWLSPSAAPANWRGARELERANERLQGQIVDYTANHGADRRIWSPALHRRMALYVYLPPGFDPAKQYPAVMWLHGLRQDERSFLSEVVEPLDRVMAEGKLPPAIIVAPDGSLESRNRYQAGSFFINSKAGRYEDYIIQDVWGFLVAHYPIRPEREAHVLVGASMGGFAAYNLGIKYRKTFKVVIGIFPPVNLRYVDCHGEYRTHFDPCCWGWRTQLHPHEVVARFYVVIKVRLKWLTDPLFGRDPNAVEWISRENPIEMLETYGLRAGELEMYIGYGGEDEFNTTAQVESFLYRAKQLGLTVAVGYEPHGRHNAETALKLFPGIVTWLAPRVAPARMPVLPPGAATEGSSPADNPERR
jgi:S-formylglutathione hydrolase FrmB